MAALQQLPLELSESIERCAAALGDLPRLKSEVLALKATGDGMAHFASALFELELARQGDPDSRKAIGDLAEILLVFWTDGSGDELSQLHPALQAQWAAVAPMLVEFELRRLNQSLVVCWKSRDDARALSRALQDLAPDGHRRVEFARCLYHLELARLGVEGSRKEFAQRVGLLSEAYQAPDFARDLVGQDAGLIHLWNEVKPYLDEFFEAMEEQQARAMEGTKKVQMPVPPALEAPARGDVKTDPNLGAKVSDTAATPKGGSPVLDPSTLNTPRHGTPPHQPALGEGPQVPSFRTLVSNSKHSAPTVKLKPPPPPPPANLTPPGGWVPDPDVVIEDAVEAAPPPKPPSSDDLDIIEADVEVASPPPPPAITPAKGLPAVLAAAAGDEDIEVDFEPDEATLQFWDYTFAALQQAPVEGVKPRMLATESRQDRKRLTTWIDGLGPHLAVPEAKAFATLVRLMLAGETKEKSLFGQANPRRKEALGAALSLLAPTPDAAGKVAVWFELDGIETNQALIRGLELLYPFLAFCARHEVDPVKPETIAKFLEEN